MIACANIAACCSPNMRPEVKRLLSGGFGCRTHRLVAPVFPGGMCCPLSALSPGIGLASLGVTAIIKLLPPQYPRFSQADSIARPGFTLFSFGTHRALVFALIPAWQAAKPDLHTTLEQHGRTPGQARTDSGSVRRGSFSGSIALMLVIGAGCSLKVSGGAQVDPGFNPERVLSLNSRCRKRNMARTRR